MELRNPSPSIPTPVSVANGGTASTTAAAARTALGAYGAGDSPSFVNIANTGSAFWNGGYIRVLATTFASASPGQFTFSSSASDANSGVDTGIGRAAAGVLKVTDGSTGSGLINSSDVAGTTTRLSPLSANTADSSAIHTTTTPTAFSVTKSIVAASFIAGKPIHFRAWLKYGTTAVPGTLTLKVQLIKSGPTTVEMSTSGALVVTGSQTDQGIRIVGDLVPRTLGASGTIASHVEFTASSDSLLVGTSISRIVASGTAKVVDTTATQALTIEATWATSNASNTILLESLTVQ